MRGQHAQGPLPSAGDPSLSAQAAAVQGLGGLPSRNNPQPVPSAPPLPDFGAQLANAAGVASGVSVPRFAAPYVAPLAVNPLVNQVFPQGGLPSQPLPKPVFGMARERIGGQLLQFMAQQGHESCVKYALHHDIKGRPGHEARRLAQIVDAIQVDPELALEMAVRDLCGIVASETYSNKGILDNLEWNPPLGALPNEFLHTVIKQVNRVAAATNPKSPGALNAPGQH
jgi:hypothetical protein